MRAVVTDFEEYKISHGYQRAAVSRRKSRRARNAEKRSFIFIGIAAAILTFFLVLVFSARSTEAVERPLYKYYTVVEADSGDSLWSIASEHISEGYDNCGQLIDEIMSINHLSGETIDVGQHIVVPYYSTEYKD
jgi:hypothetical protein